MTFKNKIIAGFGIALAILILVGVLSYRTMVRNDEDRQWVTHTHQVLEQVDLLLTDLLNAETGERGFILTGEESFLEPYKEALARLNGDVKDLHELISDNPIEQGTMDRVEPLITERLGMLRDRIEVRKKEGLISGAEIVRQGPGKQYMDKIRAQLSEMKQEEIRLLALRTEEAAKSSRNTRTVIVTGEVLAVAFLCLAGMVVAQEIGQRRRAEMEVRTLNTDLERRVADRTAELSERAKELARSNSELQQFAYVASHDLQEPLRMVASFNDTARNSTMMRANSSTTPWTGPRVCRHSFRTCSIIPGLERRANLWCRLIATRCSRGLWRASNSTSKRPELRSKAIQCPWLWPILNNLANYFKISLRMPSSFMARKRLTCGYQPKETGTIGRSPFAITVSAFRKSTRTESSSSFSGFIPKLSIPARV